MSRSPAHLKLVAGLGVAVLSTTIPVAAAETPPPADSPADTPIDVVVHETPPQRRLISVEFNPLPLLVGKLSANVVIVPVDHHALVLCPFYVSTTTAGIYVFNDQGDATQLPTQTFSGFGGEIGYRYYTGLGGPRGLFVGPSLILASMTAKAQNGSTTGYLDYGIAGDIGYEMLVADNVALAVGGGVQYATPSQSIPSQQFPADVYANGRVMPRALASIGWAF
jgi:hypothetical protein